MGTRGAYGFRMGGKDKVTYNHFDSYPSGLGSQVVNFIYVTPDDVLVDMFNKIQLVNEDTQATLEQQQECKEFSVAEVGSRDSSNWYCLLHLAQGELNVYHKIPYMLDYSDFLLDGLFCEWAYIINLDDMTLEVYQGREYNLQTCMGRYAVPGMKRDEKQHSNSQEYRNFYCVSLLSAIPIENIRSSEFNWGEFIQSTEGE